MRPRIFPRSRRGIKSSSEMNANWAQLGNHTLSERGERTQNDFPILILPQGSCCCCLIKRGNLVFVVPARNYLFLPAVRKFSQFLNGYWKRQTGASLQLSANIDIVAPSLLLSPALADCKSFNSDKHCHRWDFLPRPKVPAPNREPHKKRPFYVYYQP